MAANTTQTVVRDKTAVKGKVKKVTAKAAVTPAEAAEPIELEITEEDIRKLVNRGKRRGGRRG